MHFTVQHGNFAADRAIRRHLRICLPRLGNHDAAERGGIFAKGLGHGRIAAFAFKRLKRDREHRGAADSAWKRCGCDGALRQCGSAP